MFNKCTAHQIIIADTLFQMIPSPDWIVGVSNENLCLSNGSWTDHRTIDLYPADAGVDRYGKWLSLHGNIYFKRHKCDLSKMKRIFIIRVKSFFYKTLFSVDSSTIHQILQDHEWRFNGSHQVIQMTRNLHFGM